MKNNLQQSFSEHDKIMKLIEIENETNLLNYKKNLIYNAIDKGNIEFKKLELIKNMYDEYCLSKTSEIAVSATINRIKNELKLNDEQIITIMQDLIFHNVDKKDEINAFRNTLIIYYNKVEIEDDFLSIDNLDYGMCFCSQNYGQFRDKIDYLQYEKNIKSLLIENNDLKNNLEQAKIIINNLNSVRENNNSKQLENVNSLIR